MRYTGVKTDSTGIQVNQILYLTPSRKAQVLLLLVTLFGFFIFAITQWLSGLPLPASGASREALDNYAHTVSRGTEILLGASIIFAAVWSYYMGRMGIKGLACREFPPPGTSVILKTRIRTGAFAVLSSWLAILIAVSFWLPVIAIIYSLVMIDKYSY